MGRVETWTWSVRRGSQQFISREIMKSDPVSCFLRVDPILTGFDRFYWFLNFKPDFTRFTPFDS